MIPAKHLDCFVARFITRLPDSFRDRKQDLVTLLCLLPKTYPRRTEIRQMIEMMRAHELEQMKFQELLKPAATSNHNSEQETK